MDNLALTLIENERIKKTGKLDLGNCGLTEIPDEVFELPWLVELILSNKRWYSKNQNDEEKNRLDKIPEKIIQLSKLTILHLAGETNGRWGIQNLKPLKQLANLKTLEISYNLISKLENLPQQLNSLSISNNQISKLENLPQQLNSLDISSNQISKLENLPQQLNSLSIYSNQISKLENLPKQLNSLGIFLNQISKLENLPQQLNALDISFNQISKLENLPQQLNSLDISSNQISKLENLPQQLNFLSIYINRISKLENLPLQLNSLTISSNQINKLENLPQQLNSLDISNNKISKLENLPQQLNSLDISNNKISKLENLPQQLNSLSISNNQISKLENLPQQLNSLSISSNQISKLENLPQQLNSLEIRNNNIIELTPIKALILSGKLIPVLKENDRESASVNEINVKGNPLTAPPPETIKKGRDAILRYFEALDKEFQTKIKNIKKKEIKIIIVGNSTVGKSTLVNWFKTEKIKKQGIPSTHGMEITEWVPNLQKRNQNYPELIRFFDFGGQEYYHDSHHLFFTENTIYLLLWEKETNIHGTLPTSIKDSNAGEITIDLDHHPVEYWLEAITHYTKNNESSNSSDLKKTEIDRLINYLIDRNKEYKNLGKLTNDVVDKSYLFAGILKIEERAINNPLLEIISERLKNNSLFLRDFDENSLNELRRLVSLKDDETQKQKTKILIIQNKTNKDGIIQLNGERLISINPNIYDLLSISIFEESRLLQLKEILFDEVFQKINILQGTIPGYWNEIKNWILKQNEIVISKDDFKLQCHQIVNTNLPANQVTLKDEEIEDVIDYLKGLGVILYYPDTENLKDNIFLKPQRLLSCIYRILNNELRTNEGQLSLAMIKSKSGELEGDLMKNLMLRFRLISELPDNQSNFIAPQYLSDEPDTRIQFFIRHFEKPKYKYVYPGFVHKSIILHFFAEYGKFVLKETNKTGNFQYYFWKQGIVIDKHNQQVLVKFNCPRSNNSESNQHEQSITVHPENGKTNMALVREIIETFDRLNSGWNTEKMVSVDGEEFIKFEKIVEANRLNHSMVMINNKQLQLGLFKDFLNEESKFPMKKLFISYSKYDMELKNEFLKHLSMLKANNYISFWHDEVIKPGEKWNDEISKNLKESDIVIFLVSHNLLSTKFIMDYELSEALKGVEKRGQVIVPVILDYCDWESSPLGAFQAANKKAFEIKRYANINKGFLMVVNELKRIIKPEND